MEKELQKIYDSEINFEISCFWDSRFKVRLGDPYNGWIDEDVFVSLDEVVGVLREMIFEHLPDSGYAKKYKPTPDKGGE